MSQKPAVCGPFFRSLGNVGDWPTGWLTFQVSNSQIPDRNKPFEILKEFPLILASFGAGDFCTCRLHTSVLHPSLRSWAIRHDRESGAPPSSRSNRTPAFRRDAASGRRQPNAHCDWRNVPIS